VPDELIHFCASTSGSIESRILSAWLEHRCRGSPLRHSERVQPSQRFVLAKEYSLVTTNWKSRTTRLLGPRWNNLVEDQATTLRFRGLL
jgi:hypothetical protein